MELSTLPLVLQVMAAYLMSTEGLSADAALDEVRQKRPICCPNDGFVEQLGAFEAMNSKLQTQHPAYKKYRVRQLSDQWQQNSTIDTANLPDPDKSGSQVNQLTCGVGRLGSAHQRRSVYDRLA